MAETTVSLRIDKAVHRQMKQHDEINWSAALRKAIAEQLEKLERIDTEQATRAAHLMDAIRRERFFDRGKPAVEVIRSWREKRR